MSETKHEKSGTKAIVTLSADAAPRTPEKVKTLAKEIGDKLGVCEEDIVILPGVSSVVFTAIPTEMVKAKEKADAEAKAKAEADEKARADAEAEVAARSRAEATVKAKAEADAAKEIEAATKAELAKQHAADRTEKAKAHT